MSINKEYQPKYPVGYEYRVGNASYFIEKIERGMYFERCSSFAGYVCSRCDVFDVNHGASTSVSLGIGLTSHPESRSICEPA